MRKKLYNETMTDRQVELFPNKERDFINNALDTIDGLVLVLDRQGRILRFNRACEKATGYTFDEVMGRQVWDFLLTPEEIEPVKRVFADLRAGMFPNRFENYWVARDRRRLLISWSNTALLDQEGNVEYIVPTGIDITERKRFEEQLYQAKRDWEDTFDTITDMVTVHDRNFNIIRANKAAERILGLPVLEAGAEKCYEHYHGTGCPPQRCASCQSLMTGKPTIEELYEPHLNMFIEVRAMPRFDSNNNLIGLIHVVRDITERKKLEEQLFQSQKMEAVGQLAGGIAHDFNNILSAIIGYAGILQMNTGDNNPVRTSVDHILASADRAANLTKSLLAFSRKQIINPKPVSLNEVVRNAQNFLSRIIGEDIDLRTTLSAENTTVLADAGQVEQVLMNLATNARDVMPNGGVLSIQTEITELDEEFVKRHPYGKPGACVLLSVTDMGAGMDENTRARIFEPFFTTKKMGKGTGLGLAIVYGIIKQHKGFIHVYSEKGIGTTFKIYLPLVKAPAGTNKEQAPQTAIQGGTETILIAEDDEMVRTFMGTMLKSFGYNVIESVDGEDAVKKFREHKDRIQLLMLDVIMPKKNGKEAYEEIKGIRSDIPVFFASGYPAEIMHKKGMLDKDIDFIWKPIAPGELLKKIRTALDNQKVRSGRASRYGDNPDRRP